MNNKLQIPDSLISKCTLENNLSLGIDYGTYALRYVLGDCHQRQVLEWGSYELEAEPSQKGKGNKELGTLVAFLKDLANRIPKKKVGRITIKLPGYAVTTGTVEISNVPPKDRPHLVELSIARQLDYTIEKAAYCYLEANGNGASGDKTSKEKINYNFAAAPRTFVTRLVDAVQEAFEPVPDVTIQGYAQESLVSLFQLAPSEDAIALVDIGKSTTIISAFQANRFIVERNIPIGGHDLTRAIMIMFLESHSPRASKDLEQAESLKKKSFIPAEQLEGSAQAQVLSQKDEGRLVTEDNRRLFKAMEGILTALFHDIRLTLNSFAEKRKGKKISKIYLMGGGSELKYLCLYLSEKLGIEVELLGFQKETVQFAPQADGEAFSNAFHCYATAFALCLKPKSYASLTPKEYRTVPLERTLASIIRVAIVFLMAVFINWYLYLNAQEINLQANRNLLWEYKASLQKIERPYLEMVRWQKFVQEADYRTAKTTEVLKALSQIAPHNLIFSSLDIEREQAMVTMEGIIFGDVKQCAITMTEFSKSLLASPYFEHVTVKSITRNPARPGSGHFVLTAQLVKNEKPAGTVS